MESERYALVATQPIQQGEDLTNDYIADVSDPPFYNRLCDRYGVDEAYLDERKES